MTDKETKDKMERFRLEALAMGKERLFEQMPLEALVFLGDREDSKRNTNDWLIFFLEGFKLGVKHSQFQKSSLD